MPNTPSQRPDPLLIANRGEIAGRILRTCRQMGIATVAVYSDADRGAAHVAAADAAVRIGPPPASASYLNSAAVIDAALDSGARAIHPGYGFLSERADFARAVSDAGLIWVGPPASAIEALGDKVSARRLAIEAGVAVAEGIDHDDGDEALADQIRTLGYPVMIKAAAGGGGRGMRLLRADDDAPNGLAAAVAGARREAEAAFGDGRLLVERALMSGRHVEVQVLFDQFGHGIHLGERDCSVQRRRQKVIEEAPSPAVDAELRDRLGKAALAVCRAAGYVNAGTVEFLLQPDGEFVFLEVNTRLQVEHPVTEMLTGLDLVEWQLRIAAGEPLTLRQDEINWQGHALELRLYAEDPARGYIASTGRLRWFGAFDSRARHDVGPVEGDAVTPHYDSMLAKTIVHASTRADALDRASEALEGWAIDGVITNAGQLAAIVQSNDFRGGSVDVGWLDRIELESVKVPHDPLIAAALGDTQNGGAWRSSGDFVRRYGWYGAPHSVRVTRVSGTSDRWTAEIDDGDPVEVDGALRGWQVDGSDKGVIVSRGERRWAFTRDRRRSTAAAGRRRGGANVLRAPMPGTIIEILVAEGDEVQAGQTLAIMEAMKIEHLLTAPNAGTVSAVHVSAGTTVDEAQTLIELGPSA